MRVAHLLRKLDAAEWSGTEMAMQRLLDGLRRHQVEPVVFCPRLERKRAEDPIERSGVRVERYRAFVPVLGLSRQRKQQLTAVGGNLMSFDLLPALWRERGLSLIHAHTLGRLGGIGFTVARQRKLPFVVTIHGGVLDLPQKVKSSFNAPLERGWEWGKLFGWLFQSHRLFRDADAILTCNAREAELLREQLPDRRIVVQPHSVPMELYRQDQRKAARAAFPEIGNRQVLLCLGRIDPIKNQGWLLDQAPAVVAKHPSALLVLAGPCTDLPYGSLLEERLRSLGLEGKILLTGGLPANDPRVIGLLQSASVLLLPSLSETFGLVLLEAWAAGTPVISSRTSGASALIRHGHNGWLFDLDCSASFHAALDRTLGNPEEARHLANEGGKLSEQYGARELAGRLKQLYEEVIEEHHALRNHSR
jgi:glycosyltransferase involved in cell wall biosynthesis